MKYFVILKLEKNGSSFKCSVFFYCSLKSWNKFKQLANIKLVSQEITDKVWKQTKIKEKKETKRYLISGREWKIKKSKRNNDREKIKPLLIHWCRKGATLHQEKFLKSKHNILLHSLPHRSKSLNEKIGYTHLLPIN